MSFNWKIESLLREKKEFETRIHELTNKVQRLEERENNLIIFETRINELTQKVQRLEERETTPVFASWSTIPDRLDELEQKLAQLERQASTTPKKRKNEDLHAQVEPTKRQN